VNERNELREQLLKARYELSKVLFAR
jgi:hypothetical protein